MSKFFNNIKGFILDEDNNLIETEILFQETGAPIIKVNGQELGVILCDGDQISKMKQLYIGEGNMPEGNDSQLYVDGSMDIDKLNAKEVVINESGALKIGELLTFSNEGIVGEGTKVEVKSLEADTAEAETITADEISGQAANFTNLTTTTLNIPTIEAEGITFNNQTTLDPELPITLKDGKFKPLSYTYDSGEMNIKYSLLSSPQRFDLISYNNIINIERHLTSSADSANCVLSIPNEITSSLEYISFKIEDFSGKVKFTPICVATTTMGNGVATPVQFYYDNTDCYITLKLERGTGVSVVEELNLFLYGIYHSKDCPKASVTNKATNHEANQLHVSLAGEEGISQSDKIMHIYPGETRSVLLKDISDKTTNLFVNYGNNLASSYNVREFKAPIIPGELKLLTFYNVELATAYATNGSIKGGSAIRIIIYKETGDNIEYITTLKNPHRSAIGNQSPWHIPMLYGEKAIVLIQDANKDQGMYYMQTSVKDYSKTYWAKSNASMNPWNKLDPREDGLFLGGRVLEMEAGQDIVLYTAENFQKSACFKGWSIKEDPFDGDKTDKQLIENNWKERVELNEDQKWVNFNEGEYNLGDNIYLYIDNHGLYGGLVHLINRNEPKTSENGSVIESGKRYIIPTYFHKSDKKK